MKENRIEDAIIRFKTALQLRPNIPETYSKLGEIYLKQKKWMLAGGLNINNIENCLLYTSDAADE